MRMLSDKQVARIKAQYPKGTRVELVSMSDPLHNLPAGERGTVFYVDVLGTIHIDWDCGSNLGVVPGVDHIRILEGGTGDE